ncbi:trypco2 family protein [Streptomyces sp. NPDC052225]|uniref:trypco2 family protein n=1 Tax=Streptomyces sp. NPDC052225 TaxID=3154949 RepID=UPI00342F6C20
MQIGLADALKALRGELAEAALAADGDPVRLLVESVDLELQVAVTDTAEAGGGVKFWVVSADGKISGSTAVTHTVKLQLAAESASGDRVRTGSGRDGRTPVADD